MNERNIFIEALQKASDAEREQFLSAACGDDAGLRQRVAGLLRDAQRIGDFLESPAARDTSQFKATLLPEHSEKIGDRIGPYKLLQQIGEGGMGVVYMAEQHEPVSRRVALKIIKPGMDTEQVIARFEAERQALAMMDHPNIAKVLDAGATDSGRPYFVMELVKGVPITEYCDEQHLTPDSGWNLFVPVCQAVQHAHQKGIIHRDLKPSNVLVTLYDGRPVPKVIDFGVAKATSQRLTEQTMFTEFGQVVGTLEYMSPEQAELSQLDIDTRSDIYSLGVLLYELLDRHDAVREEAAAVGSVRRNAADHSRRGAAQAEHALEYDRSVAVDRRQSRSDPAKAERPGARRTRLDRDEGAGKGPQPALRNGQRPGPRHRTLPARRAGPGLSPLHRLSFPQISAARTEILAIAASLILLAVMAGVAGTSAGLMQAAWERSAKIEAHEHADQSDRLATGGRKGRTAEKSRATPRTRRRSCWFVPRTAEREVQIQVHLSRAKLHRMSGSPGPALSVSGGSCRRGGARSVSGNEALAPQRSRRRTHARGHPTGADDRRFVRLGSACLRP